MPRPGASSSTCWLEFEKSATSRPSVLAPTVTAVEMHDGALTPPLEPSLPEATIVTMPAERKLSIAALRTSVLQSDENTPEPRLRFTAAILKAERSAKTRSRPFSWSLT